MREITLNVKGENKGHYVPGMISNGMLYISGQLSLDMDTQKVPEGGTAAHVKQALANVDRVLGAAGLTREDVVQCRIYIADMNDWDTVNQVYQDFFGSHKPARIIVSVPALHFGCLAEVEAIAEVR